MEKQQQAALTRMAASVLRPLIKVLMRHKFSHSDMTEMVRKTYVEVAYNAFAEPERRMTYSRAAVLTGLSRKEVVRLRNNIIEDNRIDNQPTHLANCVVRGWLSDANYLVEGKNPKQLSLYGTDHSFENLVKKYAGDISYAAILNELGRIGITSQSSDGKVTLVASGYLTQHDELDKIRVMSVCVSDLFGTAINKTNSPDNAIRFQRQLVYSGIEETLAKRFHDAGSEKAMALFETLNEFLFAGRSQSDSDACNSEKRVGLGIYYFEGAKQVKSVKMTSEEHA